ncbi:MAG: hypothetical protein OQL06_05885 [Gammaproteobacteria bacterium]|nr:hypothetical protein [Gammaproteobacteria bacterium]
MANPDKQSAIKNIRQSAYANLFEKVYDAKALNDVEDTFDIVAFMKTLTDGFSPEKQLVKK